MSQCLLRLLAITISTFTRMKIQQSNVNVTLSRRSHAKKLKILSSSKSKQTFTFNTADGCIFCINNYTFNYRTADITTSVKVTPNLYRDQTATQSNSKKNVKCLILRSSAKRVKRLNKLSLPCIKLMCNRIYANCLNECIELTVYSI